MVVDNTHVRFNLIVVHEYATILIRDLLPGGKYLSYYPHEYSFNTQT